ncbi:hypothetical protein DFH09DRAFT_1080828 [Mycena vulgaris]|nr:hypothetical protein DFH09DRAFT_1080828 [Mycena vulgaris]
MWVPALAGVVVAWAAPVALRAGRIPSLMISSVLSGESEFSLQGWGRIGSNRDSEEKIARDGIGCYSAHERLRTLGSSEETNLDHRKSILALNSCDSAVNPPFRDPPARVPGFRLEDSQPLNAGNAIFIDGNAPSARGPSREPSRRRTFQIATTAPETRT